MPRLKSDTLDFAFSFVEYTASDEPYKSDCIEQIRKMSVVSPEVLQYGIWFDLIFFRRIQHLPLIYFCYQYSIIITLFPRKEL